jgi:hypothetical protein
MEESNSLVRDDLKLQEVSQRLAEQTDQLLDLLTELNAMPQVPKTYRFDLRTRHETTSSTTPMPSIDSSINTLETAHSALRKARYQLQMGTLTGPEYDDLKASILQSPEFAAENAYSSLTQIPFTRPSSPFSEALTTVTHPFLTTKLEETCLSSIDAYISGASSHPRSHASSILQRPKPSEIHKQIQLHNPVSVYNWIKHNRPSVFMSDSNEASGDRSSRATGSRAPKRNTTTSTRDRDSIIKQEQEMYDDEGIAIDAGSGAGSRGKRKRDEDGGYRPKGGNPRAGKRRKTDDGDKDSGGKDRAGVTGGGRSSKKGSVDLRP